MRFELRRRLRSPTPALPASDRFPNLGAPQLDERLGDKVSAGSGGLPGVEDLTVQRSAYPASEMMPDLARRTVADGAARRAV